MLMLGALEKNMRGVKSSTALFLLVWLEQANFKRFKVRLNGKRK